ncbi:MAG: prephenate dehydrogenase [Bacteroidota bacterium]|nr:prephenate dehydrogenase [Bacteroidota bacterium]
MIERVAIVGVGLIGGSLALAWKERRPDLTLIGWDRPDVLAAARERSIIDETATDLKQTVAGADVLILAAPIGTNTALMAEVAASLASNTIVTDVGSVKVPITHAACAHLRPDQVFIGGHPMAGAEQGGLANADAFLFENATYVLCPGRHESTPSFRALADLVEATGARVLPMDAAHHDHVAACISHVPQLLSVALMGLAAKRSQTDPAVLQLAAGGFRDMTRIASSPYALWEPVLRANKRDVTAILSELITNLAAMRHMLEHETTESLAPLFERARIVRETIPRDSKGFVDPLADIYVYAEDRAGVLAHIAVTLHRDNISIKDVELLKVREGTGGAFRLSFIDDRTANAAVAVLEAVGCRAYRLN